MRAIFSILILLLLNCSSALARDPNAGQIQTNTSAFSKNLSSADTDVQKALNTLDQLVAGGGGSSQWTGTNPIYFNGNVGIGSTSPRAGLDVDGAVYGVRFYGDGSNLTGISAGGGGEWSKSGSSVYLTDSTDNVGVGVSTPTEKLDVDGSIFVDPQSTSVSNINGIYFPASGSIYIVRVGDTGSAVLKQAQRFKWLNDPYNGISAITLFAGSFTGTPTGDITVRIETDNAGSPSGTLAHANATATTSISQYQDKTIDFPGSFSLTPNDYYHIVVSCGTQSVGSYFSLKGRTGAYADGYLKYWNGSAWVDGLAGTDMCFITHIYYQAYNPSIRLGLLGVPAASFEYNEQTSSIDFRNLITNQLPVRIQTLPYYDTTDDILIVDADIVTKTDVFTVDVSARKVGVGTADPSSELEVAGTVQATGLKMTTSPGTGKVLTSDADGNGSWQTASGGSGLTGLTPGRVPKSTSASTIADGTIYDNGNVGIGTTVPVAGLHVGPGNKSIATSVIGSTSALIKGNLEVDGQIYGDGSRLTGISTLISDGDKGDITVASSGSSWSIDNSVVSYAKMQNVSATDKVLGRASAGAGDVEEIACTATGRSILDDTSVAEVCTTIGLGTGNSPQFTGVNIGHATDTTIARVSAGVISVEGVTVPLNAITNTHTAQQIELGHATDTTITRSSAGVIAVEGVIVPLNSITNTHTAKQIELGHATDTTITRVSAGVIAVEGVTIVPNATHTGDVTGATALTIANDAVTYAKMQNVSATDKLLGRSSVGSGDVEEIACTSAGRAILDDATAADQRTTLGLGTMATATATDYVAKSTYDAQTILAAVTDNTPAAVTVAEQTIVGRKTGGNVTALTAAEVRTIINVADGAEVNVNADWNAVSGDAQILNKPTIPTQYTDEMAQDAVGNAVGNGLDYDDSTGAIAVDETELAHNSLGSKQGGTTNEYYHITAAQATVVGNTSGTNTGDNAVNSLYSGLVTNATHTGEVTGSGALTVDKTAITGKTAVTAVGTDYVLISDTSDSGNLKKALASDIGTYDHNALTNKTWSSAGHTINANVDFATYKAIAMACDNGATLPTSPTPTVGQWFLHTPTGRSVLMMYNGSAWVPIFSFSSLTIYVDVTSGTDSQNGGFGTGSDAFASIVFALAQVPPQNAGNVVINVAEGTYTESVVVQGKGFTGPYTLTIAGAPFSTQTPLVDATCDSFTKGNASGSSPTPATLTDTGAFTSFGANGLRGHFVGYGTTPTTFYVIIENTNDTLKIAENTTATSGVTTYKVYDPPTTIIANSSNDIPLTVALGQTSVYVNTIQITNSGSGSSFYLYDGSWTDMQNVHVTTGTATNGTQARASTLNFSRSYLAHAQASKYGMTASGHSRIATQNSFIYVSGGTANTLGFRLNQLSLISGAPSFYAGTGTEKCWALVGGQCTVFGNWFKNFGVAIGSDAPGMVTYETAAFGTFDTCTTTVTKPLVAWNTNSTFGDGVAATNYTQFDSTGHQTMAGTAKPWEDLRVEPIARTTGANAPTFEKWYDDAAGTSRGVYLYSFDDAAAGSEKEVFFTMQMPHAWDGGSIEFHLHWVGAVNDTTSAPRWGLEYAWKEIGQVFADTTIVYSDGNNYNGSGTSANITLGTHYISKFATIAPGTSADGLSSILIGRIFRDSANAADTYNAAGAKCGLLYIDAHYQMNSLGSTDEYTK